MRMISLLLALVIIGFIVMKQLNSSPSNTQRSEAVESITTPNMPSIPNAPKDVKKFEKDINQFMLDAEAQRKKEIEQALKEQ